MDLASIIRHLFHFGTNMRKKLPTIFLISFLSFLAWSASSKEKIKGHPKQKEIIFSNEFSGIAKALDGDSIFVGKKEVRLFGIDAPEYKQTCLDEDNEEYDCGKISSFYLKNLVNNKEVTCKYQEKDVYDRYLAKCYVGSVLINDNLLENGMAVIYDYHKAPEELKALENKAKENKKGIWRGGFELPRNYRKRNK